MCGKVKDIDIYSVYSDSEEEYVKRSRNNWSIHEIHDSLCARFGVEWPLAFKHKNTIQENIVEEDDHKTETNT